MNEPREPRDESLVKERSEGPRVGRTATISITRDTPDDIQDRWIRITIDDQPEEILRYGETLTRDVAPGRHRIKAHNTLSRDTIEIDAQPGEDIRIACHNAIARGSILMLMTTGFAFITVKLVRR